YHTLLSIDELWKTQRDDIRQRATDAVAQERAARAPKPGDLTADIVETVGALVRGQYDPEHGGFGREPKFPQVNVLRFVLDEYRRHEAPELAIMLRTTLDAMSSRGMYDHVAGGFFRYATRRDWNVPHYEKMLEDNAELLSIYAEAHAAFPDAGYDRIVRDVVRWMDASLFQEETGLWSGSQDADEQYYTLDADERAKHGAPFVDRTLYTSWNGLAAMAYLTAGRVLSDEAIRTRGRNAALALDERMRDASGALHRYDDGSGPRLADQLGDLAAHVAVLHAIGDLAGATAVAARMRERLEDPEQGGFFDTPAGTENGRLARRERPLEENAQAADALIALAVATDDETLREVAVRALRSFVGEYRGWGQFAASYANAVARALREPVSVAVVSRTGDAAGERLWRAATTARDPDLVARHLDPDRDAAVIGERGFPADRVAAYVCVGTTCSAPLTDEGSLTRELDAARERLEAQTA
ncbi:MAG TPA: hypothetical protein VJQ09_04495, partial [Candidatus Limnocylindria bacterium]|nr:hypothetical protein [Candidatus Limnocylindria bacterium]